MYVPHAAMLRRLQTTNRMARLVCAKPDGPDRYALPVKGENMKSWKTKLQIIILLVFMAGRIVSASYIYPEQNIDWIVQGTGTETYQSEPYEAVIHLRAHCYYSYTTYAEDLKDFTLQWGQIVQVIETSRYPAYANDLGFKIYDIAGRLSASGTGLHYLPAGSYRIKAWAASSWVSGLYFWPTLDGKMLFQTRDTLTAQVSASDSGNFHTAYDPSSGGFISSGDTDYSLSFRRPDGAAVSGTLSAIAASHSAQNPDVELSRTGETSGSLSAVITKTVFVNDPPPPSKYISGAGLYSLHDISKGIKLEWSQAQDPNNDPLEFKIYLGADRNNMIQVCTTGDTYYTVQSLEFNTTYYWRVATVDTAGASAEGETSSFVTVFKNSPPEPFSIASDTGTIITRKIINAVAWQNSPDPDGDTVIYKFGIGTASSAVEQGLNEVILSSPAYFFDGFSFGTTYYWTAKAVDPYGLETPISGGIQYYHAVFPNSPPQPVLCDSPETIITRDNRFDFNWQNTVDPDGDAVNYRFLVSTNPLLLTEVQSGTMTAYNLEFEFNTTYYYKVAAVDPYGAKAETKLRLFYGSFLSDPPDALRVTAGFMDSPEIRTMESKVNISWEKVTNPQNDHIAYQVLLGGSPADMTPVIIIDKDKINTFSTPSSRFTVKQTEEQITVDISGLEFYKTYFVKISASTEYLAKTETPIKTFSLQPVSGMPQAYNYPNPFKAGRENTNIVIIAPPGGTQEAEIAIYTEFQDIVRRLRINSVPAGPYQIIWDGRDSMGRPVFNGTYICRVILKTGSNTLKHTFIIAVAR